jgi:hypothetical protein
VPVGTMKILKHINQKHEKDSASYYKRSEEWVMILACCNMSHNNKLEFVFIEKSPPPPNIYMLCLQKYSSNSTYSLVQELKEFTDELTKFLKLDFCEVRMELSSILTSLADSQHN